MSYQSPINVIMNQMNIYYENEIYKAVQNAGINIDKDELQKALQYDRGQYQKGYADRDSEIVRCNECRYYNESTGICRHGIVHGFAETWFCADGKRRTDDD